MILISQRWFSEHAFILSTDIVFVLNRVANLFFRAPLRRLVIFVCTDSLCFRYGYCKCFNTDGARGREYFTSCLSLWNVRIMMTFVVFLGWFDEHLRVSDWIRIGYRWRIIIFDRVPFIEFPVDVARIERIYLYYSVFNSKWSTYIL